MCFFSGSILPSIISHHFSYRSIQIDLASNVSQLNHLHLRYCKRITDVGINAITSSMSNLYSFDLSFCTRVTAAAIFNLLETRYDCLSELRLKNCTNLAMVHDSQGPQTATRTTLAGRLILNALEAHGAEHCLSILDVRECGKHALNPTEPYPENDPFVQGMVGLQFQQRVPGFFCRPARWNSKVQNRLVEQILAEHEIVLTG